MRIASIAILGHPPLPHPALCLLRILANLTLPPSFTPAAADHTIFQFERSMRPSKADLALLQQLCLATAHPPFQLPQAHPCPRPLPSTTRSTRPLSAPASLSLSPPIYFSPVLTSRVLLLSQPRLPRFLLDSTPRPPSRSTSQARRPHWSTPSPSLQRCETSSSLSRW